MPSSSSSRRGRSRTNSTTNPELLWVNRTPESETLSTTRQEREELRTITSHARQWRAALRRQQRLYSAQTEATRAQRVVGWGRPGALSETSSAETSAAPSPPALALATSTTGTMADQFAYLETPSDGWWSPNAFQYSVQVWLPDVFRDLDLIQDTWPSSSNSSQSIPDTINRIVQGCLANRMHMYALLAASSGFKKFVLRQQLDRHDAPEYCMGKALQHLRHYLSGPTHPAPRVDELLIFDLMALSIFELYVDNPEGARTHFNMVHHLEQMLGGAETLEPALRALCRSWDLLVAGASGEPPLIGLTWDPGSLPSAQMREVILPELARHGIVPSGVSLIQHAQHVGMVHCELRTAVIDAVQWFQVMQHCQLRNHVPSPTEWWARRRAYALAHRLLSISSPSPQAGSPGGRVEAETFLSECLRQALLLVISDMGAMPPATGSDATSACARESSRFSSSWADPGRLCQALIKFTESMEREAWQDEHGEKVLWMACLGAQLAERHEDRDWCLGLARDLARRQGLSRGMDGLVQLMARYIHRCEPTGVPRVSGFEDFWNDRA
ncbi:hypothetical protein LTR67_009553 [Exophiala xenobiotica]